MSEPGAVAVGSPIARERADPADVATGARAIRDFAVDLHRRIGGGVQNLVVSPWSIVMAVAMARAGAAGETASEMDAVLHADPSDPGALHRGLNALDAHLAGLATTAGDTDAVQLRSANAVWAQSGLPLEGAFLDALAREYGAATQTVDFAGSTESARLAINDWVDGRTAGKIPDLLAPGVLDDLTRLVLTNAVHLWAPWARRFEDAQPAPFHLLDGSTIDVWLMPLRARLAHRDGDGWQAVTLPYAGGGLAMTVVVPDAGQLAVVDQRLEFDSWLAPARPRQMILRLPRFELDVGTRLADVLKAMGMPLAFDEDQADFSGITRADELHIDDVVHRATVTVDENGTEAAAATAVIMATRTAMIEPEPPIELMVDRPFLFLIHDQAHNTPLFLGRVVNPTD